MRTIAVRVLAVFFALTWLVFPGFGLADLSVSWDPDWPVVLEASWGVVMSVLVGGSFLAVAVAPRTAAPAQVVWLVTLGTWCAAAVVGQEPELLLYIGLLAAEAALLARLVAGLPDREPLFPIVWSARLPLLVVAAAGVVPGIWHAERMFRGSRRNAGEAINELTMNVDHYPVQGAWALALPGLALLAACWPRGRTHLGLGAGLSAAYVGLVSYSFPGSWAGFSPFWSVACMVWGAALVVLSLPIRVDRRAPVNVG